MDYRKFGNTYMLRIDVGEEIVESLKEMCAREGIRLAQVSAIGAADRASVGVYDLTEKRYHQEDLEGFMEIANLSGSVTEMNGEPYIHLHGTLADQRNILHGGHVISMRVGATCEMFVQAVDGTVTREKDEGLGINLWKF
ncbi:MAG: DNA-binding protein [Clostridia bacterium]|nr:DNA-binding protein [Clostridia bacterium]